MNWKTSMALLAALASPLAASAGAKLGEAASIDNVEIKGAPAPGGKVTAIVHVKVDKGFHTQSNKPSEPTFIPTVLTLKTPAGVKAGAVKYPEGKSYTQQGVSKPLSVYEEDFEISVPLAIKADASLPITISATLGYQACNSTACFPPQKLNFDINLSAK